MDCNQLCYNFINHIAQGYREIIYRVRIFLFFGIKSGKGGTKRRENYCGSPRVFHEIPYILFEHVPIGMEKIYCEPVWSQRFSIWNILDFLLNLFH